LKDNPVTTSLLSRIADGELARWVHDWDEFERLAVRVYRRGRASLRTRWQYRRLRGQLVSQYPRWQDQLSAHWPGLLAAGKRLRQDPFAALLAIENASAFVDNWQALQLLPAAREALNAYLIGRLQPMQAGDSAAGKV